MSSLALLMKQHQQKGQESACEKDSGMSTSCRADKFESTQKNTSCHHYHHHRAPPRQYSSSSTSDDDDDDSPELDGPDAAVVDETQPPACSSYSDQYIMAAMHPCSPKSAPTWSWMHNRPRRTHATNKRSPKPFGGTTKNSHIAASIEALNRQYHQQIYLGTTSMAATNGCLEDEGDVSCSDHRQEEEEEKTSPELNNARLPEGEVPEETMFELEM